MKKITITKANQVREENHVNGIPVEITMTGPEEMDASDGYHTFTELYDHRITLFIALCKHKHELLAMENPGKHLVWRSRLHSDGSSFDGWFVLGIGKEKGKQITYHLPNDRWDEVTERVLTVETLDRAPEWDGHTPADVLERLKNL